MRILYCFCIFFIVVVLFVNSQEENSGEFGTDSWRSYLEFLSKYNTLHPFRRLIMVYSMQVIKLDSREATRMEKARVEASLTDIEQKMSKSFSSDGISVSSIRLPPPRGFNVVNMLRLREQSPQPPITVALFSPDSFHASFIREVAESGALNGNKVSWIVLSFNSTWNEKILTADLGLRADSTILAVNLPPTGIISSTIQRWNGYQLDSKQAWSGGTGNAINMELTDYRLSIAVFQDPPFIFTDENKNVSGWFVDVWKDIQDRLRFTTSYYIPSSTGSSQGSLFRRAASELREGRADVVLGPFVLTEREMDECDFSAPVTTIKYRFYVQRATTQSSEAQFINPFSMRLWYATWGTVALAATLMAFTYLVGRFLGVEPEDGPPMYNIKESVLIIFGSLLQQGPDFTPSGLGSRIILWCSYAFGLVVYTAYAAALISSLTVRTVDPPFTTLETMLASNYMPYMVADSAVHRVTQSAQKGAWRELEDRRPRYTLTDSLMKGIEAAVYSSNVALLASRERTLPKIQSAPLNCHIAQLPNNILNAPGSMLLQKNSPFKSAIDQQILQMLNTGRLDRFRQRWMGLVYDDPCPVDTSLPQFGLPQVSLPFKIFGAGLCIAFSLLLFEYIAKRFLDTQETANEIVRRSSMAVTTPRKKLKRRSMVADGGPPPLAFLR